MKVFLLIRRAVLMEDEGREHSYGVFNSREAAEKHRDEITKNNTGYFRNNDFRILEDVNDH